MPLNLWFACHTQEEIAEAVGMSQRGVGVVLEQNETFRFVLKPGDLVAEFTKNEKLDDSLVGKVLEDQSNQLAAEHATDFQPPSGR